MGAMKPTIKMVKPGDLAPFEGNPFGMRDIEALAQSIEDSGVLVPLLARSVEGGSLHLIDGHRRKAACELAGVASVPVPVVECDDDAAAVAVVDANLMQRETVLPSEHGFAYKMKLEVIRHQGKASGTRCQKWSRELVTDELKGRQVQNYVRLTELVPELLAMVDEGRIALRPAVELSYLTKEEQRILLEACEEAMATPSHTQAIRLKEQSCNDRIDRQFAAVVMAEDKPDQAELLKLPLEKVGRFFPKSYTPRQMEDTIVKLLEQWQRKRQQSRDTR
jgi:ParB family chromosome partitioning protein